MIEEPYQAELILSSLSPYLGTQIRFICQIERLEGLAPPIFSSMFVLRVSVELLLHATFRENFAYCVLTCSLMKSYRVSTKEGDQHHLKDLQGFGDQAQK